MVSPVPEGYHSVTPYLIVKNCADAIEWYKKALGATEKMRLPGPDGSVMHAEIQVGDSPIMMGEENPQMGATAPETLGGSPVSICLYVDDVDASYPKAIAAGGTELRPLQDQFYGDRSGTLKDPFGHTWTIATHIEDVSDEDIQKRMAEMFAG